MIVTVTSADDRSLASTSADSGCNVRISKRSAVLTRLKWKLSSQTVLVREGPILSSDHTYCRPDAPTLTSKCKYEAYDVLHIIIMSIIYNSNTDWHHDWQRTGSQKHGHTNWQIAVNTSQTFTIYGINTSCTCSLKLKGGTNACFVSNFNFCIPFRCTISQCLHQQCTISRCVHH